LDLSTVAPRTNRHLRFAGIGESTLAERVAQLSLPESVEIAYLTRLPENHVRLRGPDRAAVTAAAEAIIGAAPHCFVGEDDVGLVERLLAEMERRGLTIGTAESCTGGLIGGAITAVPGSSASFCGGVISYSNAIKREVLGVSQAILDTEGAVSEACAAAMARGVRRVLECDIGVAVTGIAGPGGARPGKPVGTVCFGWAGAGLDGSIRRRFRGDRERVRIQALGYALDHVRRGLSD
jgi:PncC family amidohydrolase